MDWHSGSQSVIPVAHGIRGYVSETAAFQFARFLVQGICFVKNNREAYFIGDMFISYDR
jgi:hypothetical protein